MNLKDFSQNRKRTTFDVSGVTMEEDQNGKKIAVLHLTKPIDTVIGSMTIGDRNIPGSDERVKAFDVEMVRVHERLFEDKGIDLKEENGVISGTVNSDLILDIATSRGTFDVWLTDKTFRAFGNEKRFNNINDTKSGLLSKMQEKQAARTYKGVDVNATGNGQPVKPVSVENKQPEGAGTTS